MRPPYLIHTDVHDERVTPGLYVPYDAGKTSPKGRRKDWDIGLEDTGQPETAAQPILRHMTTSQSSAAAWTTACPPRRSRILTESSNSLPQKSSVSVRRLPCQNMLFSAYRGLFGRGLHL